MKLLQGAVLSLLLSGFCFIESIPVEQNSSLSAPPSTISVTYKTPILTSTKPINPALQSTAGPSSKEITTRETLKSSLMPTITALTTEAKNKGDATTIVLKNVSTPANTTVTSFAVPSAAPTLRSFQNQTETQKSIKTTEGAVNTSQSDALSSQTSTQPSVSMPENILQSQGTENGKNVSSSLNSPTYSSIILPVVIALIVITLSVFALVGLYRICRKTDPGTSENGNDQPQSDKESVKLLTVKTISQESGEHSAQGKTKN